jgi:hypothetical protein
MIWDAGARSILFGKDKFTTEILSNPNVVWQFVIPVFAKQYSNSTLLE